MQRYLSLRERGLEPGHGGAGGALAPLRAAAAAAGGAAVSLLAALVSPLGLLAGQAREAAGAAPAAAPSPPAAAAASSAGPVADASTPAAVVAEASAPDMSQVDFRLSRKERQLPPRHTARPAQPAAAAAAAAALAPPLPLQPLPEAAEPPEAAGPGPELRRAVAAAGAGGAQAAEDDEGFLAAPLAADITPLAGEERMWDSSPGRNVRWGRVVALAALLGGVAFAGGRVALGGRVAPAPPAVAAAAAASEAGRAPSQARAAPVAPAAAALGRAQATALIQRWQGVKSEALGPGHSLDGLRSVLGGELLEQWRARAQAVAQRGWHYEHVLEGARVEALSVDLGGGAATARCCLAETVTAHQGGGTGGPQTFRSEYTVDYQLARQPDGGWLIVGAEVRQ